MPLKTGRWPNPREPDDGLRVLITRYRPRALPKAKETWDVWMRELAPSVELLADFHGKGGAMITLEDYRRREALPERREVRRLIVIRRVRRPVVRPQHAVVERVAEPEFVAVAWVERDQGALRPDPVDLGQ